jgi:peptidoglycan/LPS O-acetylase OafA/YrhL
VGSSDSAQLDAVARPHALPDAASPPAASPPAVLADRAPRGGGVRRLGRRPALDGFRGLAVLLVIADHAHLPLRAAWIGVDLFFVLSGFLITSLLLEESARTGGIALRGFYARRARRILPALALLTVLVAAVSLTAHQLLDRWPLWEQAAATWTFAANAVVWLGGAPLGAFTATWSLACEEQFYLLWPLVLRGALRRGRGPRRLLAWLLCAALVLAAAGWAVGASGAAPGADVFFDPLGRGAELLTGCALAVAWRHRLLPRALEAASGPVALPAVAALGVLAWRAPLGTRGTYLAAAVCSALVLHGLLRERPGRLAAAFSFRPLRYTGTVSYGLYLYNDAVSRLLHHNLPGAGWPVIAPLLLAGSFACAAVSHRYVESRFLRRRAPHTTRRDALVPA